MLPTLAPCEVDVENRRRGVPCRAPGAAATFHRSRGTSAAAAAWCDRCAAASGCLLDALRLDAAFREGRDPWGVTGVCGGVWFEPGQAPARVPHTGSEIA